MANTHNMSFFGQTTGIILQSISKTEPSIFFRCIKKKPNGAWEKPSKGEGKVIKCSLEEIVLILSVLNKKSESWAAYHSFKDTNTQIQFKWDENTEETLWVHIGSYSKMLKSAQIEILRLVLTHILNEKIEFATNSKEIKQDKFEEKTSINKNRELLEDKKRKIYKDENRKDMLKIIETVEPSLLKKNDLPSSKSLSQKTKNYNPNKKQFNKIIASIKRKTKKALLLEVENGKEVWIPKSGIKKDYSEEKGISQSFNIENWILEKNNILN